MTPTGPGSGGTTGIPPELVIALVVALVVIFLVVMRKRIFGRKA